MQEAEVAAFVSLGDFVEEEVQVTVIDCPMALSITVRRCPPIFRLNIRTGMDTLWS